MQQLKIMLILTTSSQIQIVALIELCKFILLLPLMQQHKKLTSN